MMQSYADCWLVHLADWRKRLECWLCFFFLRGGDGRPPKQNLTGGIPVVYLDWVLISSIQGGGGLGRAGGCNKQCISWMEKTKTCWDPEWAVFRIVFQFVKHCRAPWHRFPLHSAWEAYMVQNTLINGWVLPPRLTWQQHMFPSALDFI